MNLNPKPKILPPVIDKAERIFANQILKGVLLNPDITAQQKESLSWAMNTINNNLKFKELSSVNGVTVYGHPYDTKDTSRHISYAQQNDGTLLIEYGSAADAKIYDANGTIAYSIHTFKHEGDDTARAHHHGNKSNPRADVVVRQKESEKVNNISAPSNIPSNVRLESPFNTNKQLQVG